MSTSTESTQAIETKIKELENVNRLVTNTINLINDVEIKGAYSAPVAEILGWLAGFKQSVGNQVEAFKSALPKPEGQDVAVEVKEEVKA